MRESPYAFESDTWVPAASARRFEAGTPNMLGIHAMEASLKEQLRSEKTDTWSIQTTKLTGPISARISIRLARSALELVAKKHAEGDNGPRMTTPQQQPGVLGLFYLETLLVRC